jgi:hypothetical protein
MVKGSQPKRFKPSDLKPIAEITADNEEKFETLLAEWKKH